MGGRKVTLTFSEEDLENLECFGKENGFSTVSGVIRYFTIRGLKQKKVSKNNSRIYEIELDRADEVEDYVYRKRLGSVSSFATQSLEREMQRHPLTVAQKAIPCKLID